MTARHKSQSAYGQILRRVGDDYWYISWVVDRYYAGSRLRHPTVYRRHTDDAGAVRFAKRHGLQLPITAQEDTP